MDEGCEACADGEHYLYVDWDREGSDLDVRIVLNICSYCSLWNPLFGVEC
jgi:hypothetical protein